MVGSNNRNEFAPTRRQPSGRALVFATAAVIACGTLSNTAIAEDFPAVIDLGSLDGTNGFKLDGEKLGDYSGVSVSAAGDVNGDGVDDLIIGAYRANLTGRSNAGRSYVLFGNTAGFSSNVQLAELDGSPGFKIDGETSEDESGASVDGAGDVNGDGIDDIIIGAWFADPNGDRSGRSYVLFGNGSGFSSPRELADLDGTDGLKLDGESSGDRSGHSVAGAGDINGDGVDDVIIGAHFHNSGTGRSYVVFGDGTGLPSPLQLADLNGIDGFRIDGERSSSQSGFSVSAAGDINDDGYDDLIIGAPFMDDFTFTSDGRSYVLFGKGGGFDGRVALGGLGAPDGFKIDGVPGDQSGSSVGGAGDVNGDGIPDLVIGAPGADPNGNSDAGSTYIVFGRSNGFSSALDLSTLDGNNGFRMDGESSFDKSGTAVSSAGDINGDGVDDVIIGAPPDPRSGKTGRSYVVFGRNGGFPATMQLANLDGTNGFRLDGEGSGDEAGISVGAAGDVNGDGIGDVIVGARGNDANGAEDSGRSYVVYGRGTPVSDGADDDEPTILFVDSFEN